MKISRKENMDVSDKMALLDLGSCVRSARNFGRRMHLFAVYGG